MRRARTSRSWPWAVISALRSRLNHCLIFERARGVATKVNQSREGPTPSPLAVRISTESPLESWLSRGTMRPLTLAPTALWPTSVWMA